MTYVELIVVLSIFATMSAISIFDYGKFQSQVDIKNLSSDIALKIVQAQKDSLAGKLPPATQQGMLIDPANWKPSYGLFFTTVPSSSVDNKSFVYFTDTDNPTKDNLFNGNGSPCNGECLELVSITKNNTISSLDVVYSNNSVTNLNDLTISFSRPSSTAVIKSYTPFALPISYARITVTSPNGVSNLIKVYPSGRIQVN